MPMTFVGYGYDIFGYPAPNNTPSWDYSGVLQPNPGIPTKYYAPYDDAGNATTYGSDTAPATWKAGPIDLRWDQHRKVWTGNHGVYPGIIYAAYSGSTAISGSGFNKAYWSADLRYDAYIYDGLNSGLYCTGVSSSIFQPPTTAYKVYPTPTGAACIIAHVPNSSGQPRFGLLTWEMPYTTGCATATTGTSSFVSDYAALTALLGTTPLSPTLGGIGLSTLPQGNAIIVGSDDFTYQQLIARGSNYIKVINDGTNFTFDSNRTFATITGTYVTQAADLTYFTNITSTGKSIYLCDATTRPGQEIFIKDQGHAGSYNIKIYPLVTGQLIDGISSYTINANYQCLRLMNDGNNWYIL